ncbi:AAA family ATPase [Cronbergia sp. UHCC 0137]|uniref:AAA family ATPase n=1 Tax=Cronbergia sp. UHCC 0137 TaxID=3110239 RepID=UPI002B1EFB33|nr:AAA family ATPase [Cronbergia sp. UHCC 0137]MEA5619430.1 AAA family ATPase [Cronbergia sp. UHCC 0137]
MLKRIYIDNFNCLVDFELKFDSINLFLGNNGAGKSTVFEALRRIQHFVLGFSKVEGVFLSFNCTRWQKVQTQRFELEIDGNGGNYEYLLTIEHDSHRSYVKHEQVLFNDQVLLNFSMGEVQIFDDNYSHIITYPFEWSQSILPFLQQAHNTTKLTWFKKRMERFILVKIVPSQISGSSEQEQMLLNSTMDNYFSWYRYISRDQGKVAELMNCLKGVLDGFIGFKFLPFNDGKVFLSLAFSSKKNKNEILNYSFDELSDGQKIIIVLYTLLYCTKSEDYTICIDEPENFLALPEIQPWLTELYDFCSENQIQALLISHHPVLINYLLASPIGYWFERESNAPVKVKKISNQEAENTGLAISELIERGWLYDPA